MGSRVKPFPLASRRWDDIEALTPAHFVHLEGPGASYPRLPGGIWWSSWTHCCLASVRRACQWTASSGKASTPCC